MPTTTARRNIVNTRLLLMAKGYGAINMSDYHEMYENFRHEYDPHYFYEDEDESDNKPVDPDDWARNNEDFDGGP